MADRPPHGREREASRPSTQAMPRRRSTKARENALDLRDVLEDKARQTRSIYRSSRRPTARDSDLHSGYNKSGRAEHNRHSPFELRRDIAQYRGAAHPLCFTDEVMDHKIPEGFKPVNSNHMIEQQILRYGLRIISSRSTWPAAMIYTPSNTSRSNLRDRPGIGLIACQQTQSVLRRTWKPHSSTTSRALMCDRRMPAT